MGSVVSATTGRAYGDAPKTSRSEAFAAAAEELLLQAHAEFEEGRNDLAMEYAYRAALRIAGAFNAQSSVLRKRKRLPSSAWDKLALTGEEGAAWARTFSRYSAQRGRVASGIESAPAASVVAALLSDVDAFYLALQGGVAPLAA